MVFNNGIKHHGISKRIQKSTLILVIMLCSFQLKGNKSHLGKFTRKWFGPYKVLYVLPNNMCYW
jgi:hypothetical protein